MDDAESIESFGRLLEFILKDGPDEDVERFAARVIKATHDAGWGIAYKGALDSNDIELVLCKLSSDGERMMTVPLAKLDRDILVNLITQTGIASAPKQAKQNKQEYCESYSQQETYPQHCVCYRLEGDQCCNCAKRK